MKDYAKSFYKGAQWRKVSRLYMESRHYICERCGRPAVICHHRKYITPANINDPAIALNPDNLEALCADCHNKEHKAKNSKAIFDAAGNMIGAEESAEIEAYKEAVKKLTAEKSTAQNAV